MCYSTHYLETRSALVVTNTATGKRVSGVDVARIYFHRIPNDVMDAAVQDGSLRACAGGIRVEEEPFRRYVKQFDGMTDSTSGMPLALLKGMLGEVS